MHTFELIVGPVAVVVLLIRVSGKIQVPYPMLMLLNGLVLAVLP